MSISGINAAFTAARPTQTAALSHARAALPTARLAQTAPAGSTQATPSASMAHMDMARLFTVSGKNAAGPAAKTMTFGLRTGSAGVGANNNSLATRWVGTQPLVATRLDVMA